MKQLSPYLYFLPLFVIYLLVIILMGADEPEGDGIRYYAASHHFLQGQLTDPANPDIRNGPAYPLLIAPIVGLNLPVFFVHMLNVFLILGGSLYIFSLLKSWIGTRWALLAAYVVALYPPLIMEVPRVAYEALTVFLVCGYMYHLIRCFSDEHKPRDKWLAAFYLAYLALTKLIFPYIILILVVISIGLALIYKKKPYSFVILLLEFS